jgi:hypothetical protein
MLILLSASSPVLAEIEIDANGNLVEYSHAIMSDGVKIALAVGYPKDFDPKDEPHTWPTISQTSGYIVATRAAELLHLLSSTGLTNGQQSDW